MPAISNTNTLINGIAYSASQVTLILGNAILAGVKSINYNAPFSKTNNYGLSSQPISRGYGQQTYEADIELDMDTMQQLRAIAPNGQLSQIGRFSIQVVFQPDQMNINTATHTLKNCEFTDDGQNIQSGDTILWYKLKLIYAGLKTV